MLYAESLEIFFTFLKQNMCLHLKLFYWAAHILKKSILHVDVNFSFWFVCIIWVIYLLTENLIQLKTSFCHVNNMTSSGIRKMLALIKYQHSKGVLMLMCPVNIFRTPFVVTNVMSTINSIDVLWL